MVLKEKRLLYIENNESIIHIPKIFLNPPVPIIWNHNGLFGILSIGKVKNEIDNVEDIIKSGIKDVGPIYTFKWYETIPMSNFISLLIE